MEAQSDIRAPRPHALQSEADDPTNRRTSYAHCTLAPMALLPSLPLPTHNTHPGTNIETTEQVKHRASHRPRPTASNPPNAPGLACCDGHATTTQ